jgi:hypothetical protein
MKEMKADIQMLKNHLKTLENVVTRGFEERKLEMTYEIEKMRAENGFNARNIIYMLLMLFPFLMCLVFAYGIYKYFQQ